MIVRVDPGSRITNNHTTSATETKTPTKEFKETPGKELYTRYPIVARRAWPTGCIGRVRRASKGILHTREGGVGAIFQPTGGLTRSAPEGLSISRSRRCERGKLNHLAGKNCEATTTRGTLRRLKKSESGSN